MAAAGALAGIRVIDVSAAVAGPWTSTQLADHGADVLVIEPVHRPDVIRVTGPVVGDVSGAWVAFNRNKRAMAVNLRDERGLDIVLRLVDEADVFLQNFRPGVAQRLGLGYDVLSERNTKLIYTSVSGFGADGPYSERPVYDPIIQGISGLASSQGEFVRNVVVDKLTAMTAANATMAALVARATNGVGQHVEVNMLDATMAFIWPDTYWNHVIADASPVPTYSDWYEPFTTSDGQVALAWPTDEKFASAVTGLGRPDLAIDERFAGRPGRVINARALLDECKPTFAAITTSEAIAVLRGSDVPCAEVLSIEEAMVDEQVIHNAIIVDHEHPVAGKTRITRPPARMSKTPPAIRRHAPAFGEHTIEVLTGMGLSESEIESLRSDEVVA